MSKEHSPATLDVSPHGELIKKLLAYIPVEGQAGIAVRDALMKEAANAIAALHERLEDSYYFDWEGNRVECAPGSIPDGISCRDETIKLQDQAIDKFRSARSETRPIYTVEQLESWQQSFENLRREFHRQGNHDGQRGCEFALESIRLYQTGTPVSATPQKVSLRERDGCLWLDWSEGMLNLTHLVGRDNLGARRDMTKVMEELK